MIEKGVIGSCLLTSLKRFAVENVEEDQEKALIGLVLGRKSKKDQVEEEKEQLNIYGILRNYKAFNEVKTSLPGGIVPIGVFGVMFHSPTTATADLEEIGAFASKLATKQQFFKSFPFHVLIYTHPSQQVYLYENTHGVNKCPLEVIEAINPQEFMQEIGDLALRWPFQCPSDFDWARIHEQLVSGQDFFYRFSNTKGIFMANGTNVENPMASQGTGTKMSTLFKSLTKKTSSNSSTGTKKSNKNKKVTTTSTMNSTSTSTSMDGMKTLSYGLLPHLNSLQPLDFGSTTTTTHIAPLIQIGSAITTTGTSKLMMKGDVIVYISLGMSVQEVLALCIQELVDQLTLLHNCKLDQVHHFSLVGVCFPLSLHKQDDLSIEARQRLHHLWFQPNNRPLFDTHLKLEQDKLNQLGHLLFNVHQGIPNSHVQSGQLSLVDGHYAYHHYLQDNINDKGWGCAYRSLQTLCSFFYLNHFTNIPPVSFHDIQSTLVKMGDKPPSFVNSKDWIGSMEVGFILDELYGVSFRNLYVSNGPELVTKARELQEHFQTQGTPVMMGGGNLAFTLLGIDYNEFTGDVAFLILDPHYTGPEDLEIIQTNKIQLEGYKAIPCGWRKANTFAKNSFYNLCLPQRPDIFSSTK